MLASLHVKNLALIDSAEVEFQEGLNILSGETGAGKSIIIGSINLALGAKAEKDPVREGADHALIELIFHTEDPSVESLLQEMDIPACEDGELLISRKIAAGRSSFKINGESATAKQIKSLSALLIHIHGQHENQILLQKKKHLEILDTFGGEAHAAAGKAYKAAYDEYRRSLTELEETSLDESETAREISLAEYEIGEIEKADLKDGEDEVLEGRYREMLSGRQSLELAGNAYELLGGNRGENTSEMLERALRELNALKSPNESMQQIRDQLAEVEDLLNGAVRDLSDYLDRMDFSEEEFANCEDRLNAINHLKAKYGKNISDIFEYLEKRQERLSQLRNMSAYREELEHRISLEKAELAKRAEHLSELRGQTAAVLSQKLAEALQDLNFLNVELEIAVRPDPERMTASGMDEVSFLISTNPGMPMRALDEIASGGELSRIMLGLQSVLAGNRDEVTMIFDEIDAGISGKTAWKVSEKLGVLSADTQIICITHLPQIAAMADKHFCIEKKVEEGTTTTGIRPLDGEEQIAELARMLGGDELSEAAMSNARDLRRQAGK